MHCRYSTAIQQLLEARGTRTTARLGFKGLGDAGAAEVCVRALYFVYESIFLRVQGVRVFLCCYNVIPKHNI